MRFLVLAHSLSPKLFERGDRYGQVQKLLEGIRACDQRRTDRILPDIIVYHRGQNGIERNLLVVELKKDDPQDACDFAKLGGLTDLRGPFCYELGLYININRGAFSCTWFKNARVIE